MRAVVDASVALKWQLDDEEYVTEACSLRDAWLKKRKLELFAPTLILYEVTNGFISAILKGRIKSSDARVGIINFLKTGVQLQDPPPLNVFRISMKYKITAYDAAYLALAETLKCNMWTGDKHFFRSVMPHRLIRWIGDFENSGI